jgi:hypothetical protein
LFIISSSGCTGTGVHSFRTECARFVFSSFVFFFGMTSLGAAFLLSFFVSVSAQAFVAFDGASASSVYSAGSFTAEEAIAPGSGYWCRFFMFT